MVMNVFIENFMLVFEVKIENDIDNETKNIFLCILCIINPPNDTMEAIISYLKLLVESCNTINIKPILKKYNSGYGYDFDKLTASLLIKFINEKVYETICLQKR